MSGRAKSVPVMHSFPDFDYEALSSLAKRILSSRKTIQDDAQVKDWQLDDLLTYATREKMIVVEGLDRTLWRSETPEAQATKLESIPRYQMAGELERLVTAEIKRRQALNTAPAMPPAKKVAQVFDREMFIRLLSKTLYNAPWNIAREIDDEFGEKRARATDAGFVEHLKEEEQKLLKIPELIGVPGIGRLTPEEVALVLADEYTTSGMDWKAAFGSALKHPIVSSFWVQTRAQIRLWKIKQNLEGLQKMPTAQEEPQRKEKQSQKEPEVLPALDEVVKDAATFLPKLWEALAGMPNPLVSRSGTFIWSGESVSVLMALAQALKTAEKVLGNYTTEQVYRILCRHFDLPEAKRPRIKAKTETGFTNAYFDYLSDLNDTLQGL